MTLIQFFRLLNRNLNLLLLSAAVLAIAVFFLTRNLPRTFQSRTEIFTGFASGPSVQSIGSTGVDFMSSSNEFDNLINVMRSDQTLREVGQLLLTQHLMMDEPNRLIIGEEAWENFQNLIPKEARDTLTVEGNEIATQAKARELSQARETSYLSRNVFDNGNSPYSPATLGALTMRRMGNSDFLEITYSYTDPGICQNTLKFVNEIITKKLLEIKLGQTNSVVQYFEDEVEEARLALQTSEDTLESFRLANNIIDYEVQTSNIAGMQGQMEASYQAERRVNAAARSRVRQLEPKVALNKEMMKFNEEIETKRKQLANLKAQITQLEILSNDQERLIELQRRADNMQAELNKTAANRYQATNTPEGISGRSVLQDWLSATLELDASDARLRVLSSRNAQFEDAYSELSPLGAELKRLQRAVGVAEDKYIELTNNLNLALTRQQSESLSSGGLVITSPPQYPLSPIESKQLLLVLVAAVVGFIIPFAFLLILEFLDTTVRTPVRGEELTGLKLLGAYPDLTPKSANKNVDMDWLKNKAIGHIAQNLRLEARRYEKQGDKTKTVLVFSTKEREGKSMMAHQMASELAELNNRVMVISPNTDFEQEEKSYDHAIYKEDKTFLKTSRVAELLPEDVSPKDYNYIFLEIDGVLSEQYPIELVEQFDVAVCVVSAKRSWNKADNFALQEFMANLKEDTSEDAKEGEKIKPRLLVNAVEPDLMDSVIGEISKSRSFLRKFMKAVLTLQFRNQRGFKEQKA